MLIGYARVSSSGDRQTLDLQLDALKQAGVEERHIFSDHGSGANFERAGLMEALAYVTKGDTLIVWKLDRLGRSLKDLVIMVDDLKSQGVHLRSVTEGLDTTGPAGELLLGFFAMMAQFELSLAKDRIRAGVKAARDRGRVGGRPRRFNPAVLRNVYQRFQDGESAESIAKTQGVKRSTISGWIMRIKNGDPGYEIGELPPRKSDTIDIEEVLNDTKLGSPPGA